MNEVLEGIPVSKGNLKKITIYNDRLEAKEFFTPTKVFPLSEISSWSEIQVIQNPGNIRYLRFENIYRKKTIHYPFFALEKLYRIKRRFNQQ